MGIAVVAAASIMRLVDRIELTQCRARYSNARRRRSSLDSSLPLLRPANRAFRGYKAPSTLQSRTQSSSTGAGAEDGIENPPRRSRRRLSLQEDLVPSIFQRMCKGMSTEERSQATVKLCRRGSVGGSSSQKLTQQAVAQMHAMFLKYEGGENGEISKEQFIATLTKQNSILGKHAAGMFDSLDTDNSGGLSFREFVAAICPGVSASVQKVALSQYAKHGYERTMKEMGIPKFIAAHAALDAEYEKQKVLEREEVDPSQLVELNSMFDRLADKKDNLVPIEALNKYCQGFELQYCLGLSAEAMGQRLSREEFVELLGAYFSDSDLHATRIAHSLRSGGEVPERTRHLRVG